MSLKNIVGQDRAVEMLMGMMRRQRIASSYIFCGEPGIGKKTTALNFAKALNCLRQGQGAGNKKQDEERINTELPYPDACDECPSCRKIDAMVHPDLLILSPEDRIIKTEEIRTIGNALSYKPFEARKKVIIVDDAETMNISAANAFLKTLEEPPDESVIILVTSRPDMLPATIRSRCCTISFFPLSQEASRQVLSEKFSGPALELLLRLSMGRPGSAFSGDLQEERDWFVKLLKGMLKTEKDTWASREDMDRWFEGALVILRDISVLKITGDQALLINIDLRDYLAGLSKSVDLKVIINLYNELSLLKGLLLFNLNKSITWNYTASLLRKELLI